ncbi:MAG TPA: hypothetical protein VHZ31_05280 [Solirubrobacteraceae bacterium]|nr:hypothetical protein [Solirubrobacteraceae bacterium]
MNDRSTTQPVSPATPLPGEDRAELAAIVRRAGQIGIAAWRVETALGLAVADVEKRDA